MCDKLTNVQQYICPGEADTEPQVKCSVEEDFQLNRKVFHLIVDFNHASFLKLKKTKHTTMLHTMNHQINLLVRLFPNI